MEIAKKSLTLSLSTLKLSGADEFEELQPLMAMLDEIQKEM
jgi:hypothetical protein